ncbi:MAG: serine/threonine-protein kinase [Candidatus Sericytochromatia bacterium]
MAITDYDIVKQIGLGGMGAVYLAVDPRLERQVAIKKIKVPDNLDEQTHKEMVQRFYREARAIANLNHPNIVIVHELGEDKSDNQCFMVMEFLDGKSLEALQEDLNILPLNLVMKIAIQSCDALNFIHQKGIIHRDIKPANLIYCNNGVLKITDFGLVRGNDNLNLTKAGAIMGSVLFMPQEQIENPKNVDFRCDMYSFGVTMYNLLSGHFPFYGDDMYGVIRSLLTEEPQPLSKYNPNIPKDLEMIIMKAIAKKKEERFQSMDEFKQYLIQFCQKNNIDFSSSIPLVSHHTPTIPQRLPNTDTLIQSHNKNLDNTFINQSNKDIDKTIILQKDTAINQVMATKIDISSETQKGNINVDITVHSGPSIKDLPSKYLVTRELGRGGMGAVYLAHDRSLDRQVAIKILTMEVFPDRPEEQEAIIYTFKREALAIANLSHENIVNVYDIGQTKSGLHYIVMELLEGQPMTKLIEDGKPLLPEIALDAIVQISDALSYIHNHKVIHRDIKPENIMWSDKGIAKLTDFGIAKYVDDLPVNAPGNLVGTVLYISPEQLQTPDAVDGRADMYSLAASLYQLLTGKLPIDGDDVRQVIMKVLTEKPQPASKFNSNLPRSLDEVLFKAMAKDKNDRYRTMQDFKTALMGIAKYKDYLASKRKKVDTSEETKKIQRKVADYVGHVDLDWISNIGDKIDTDQTYFSRSIDYVVPKIFDKEIAEFADSLTVKSLGEKKRHWDAKIKQFSTDFERNTLIPSRLKNVLVALSKIITPEEVLHLLVSIDNKTPLGQIVENYYSKNKLKNIFIILYGLYQAQLVKLDVIHHTKGKIYIGEMLINFFFITREDLKKALKEQPPSGAKPPLGEILLKMSDLRNENLMLTLKLQAWYKGLFTSAF